MNTLFYSKCIYSSDRTVIMYSQIEWSFRKTKKLFFILSTFPFGEKTTDDFLIFRPVQMKVQIALREFVKCVCYDSVWSTRKKNNKNFSFSFTNEFLCERIYGGDLSLVCTYNECFLKQKCIAFITCIIISLRMSCTHILLSLLSFFDI